MMKTWLMVDYGGVLAEDHVQAADDELARVLGTDSKTVRSALSEKSSNGRALRLDILSEEEFWKSVCVEICPGGISPLTPQQLTKLWANCYAIKPEVTDVLREALRRGLHIGVATNVDRYRESYLFSALSNHSLVATVWSSYRIGHVKPDINYYLEVDRQLVEISGPVSCHYFDDRQSHVDAARSIGWSAIRVSDAQSIRAWLRQQQILD